MTFEQDKKQAQDNIDRMIKGIHNWRLYAGMAVMFVSLAIFLFSVSLTIRSSEQSDRLRSIESELSCRATINAESDVIGKQLQIGIAALFEVQAQADIAAIKGIPPLSTYVDEYTKRIQEVQSLERLLETAVLRQADVVKICKE